MCQPYIRSDYIDVEEIARISGFCRSAEIGFHHLAVPIYVSVDLKYDVLKVCVGYTQLSLEK